MRHGHLEEPADGGCVYPGIPAGRDEDSAAVSSYVTFRESMPEGCDCMAAPLGSWEFFAKDAARYWGSALIRRVQYSPAADGSGAARVTDSDGGPAQACGGTP